MEESDQADLLKRLSIRLVCVRPEVKTYIGMTGLMLLIGKYM